MVKCYACNKRFESDQEFWKHVREVHLGNIEEPAYETEIREMSIEEFQEYMKEHPFIFGEWFGGIAKIRKLRGVADPRYYIIVWNCHGTLILPDHHENFVDIGYFSVPKEIYREEIREDLEKLCWQVLEDRGGAINISGTYYLDEEHLAKLKELVGENEQS